MRGGVTERGDMTGRGGETERGGVTELGDGLERGGLRPDNEMETLLVLFQAGAL